MTTSSDGGARPGGASGPARPLATSEELCAVRRDVLGHVGNKWTALVLTLLRDAPLRYSELRRSCRISQRMLTLTLRELQRDGLVVRLAPDSPAGASPYALTLAGRSLCTLVTSLIGWADLHHGHIAGSRQRFDGDTADPHGPHDTRDPHDGMVPGRRTRSAGATGTVAAPRVRAVGTP